MEERDNGVWYVLSRRLYHGSLSSWIAYGAVLGLLCYVVAMIRYGRLLRQWARTLPTLTWNEVENLVQRMRNMAFCGIDFPWGFIRGRRLRALARRKQASRSNT